MAVVGFSVGVVASSAVAFSTSPSSINGKCMSGSGSKVDNLVKILLVSSNPRGNEFRGMHHMHAVCGVAARGGFSEEQRFGFASSENGTRDSAFGADKSGIGFGLGGSHSSGMKKVGGINASSASSGDVDSQGFVRGGLSGGSGDSGGVAVEGGGGGGGIGGVGGKGGGGGGDGAGAGDGAGDGAGEGSDKEQNKAAAYAFLASIGKSVDSLPKVLRRAVEAGKIPASVLERWGKLQKTTVRKWLLKLGGFQDRLLADDIFMTKMTIECGVGLFTKTAAEYERRRENFVKELDFVIADLLMGLVSDFMLVWLPAPTVGLGARASAKSGLPLAKLFAKCPDNAFQVALKGTSYSLLQRTGAIVQNGLKLFVVGAGASLLGTATTNGLIKLKQLTNKDKKARIEVPDIPVLETSAYYGVYMAVSANLRYQVLAGVIEQRLLEPALRGRTVALSASSFIVRTGNTFLGSLLWVDYARWVGVQ